MLEQSMHPVAASHALFLQVGELGSSRQCFSNMSPDTNASLQCRREFFAHFHGVMIHAEMRINKPDPAIFKLLLQRFEPNAFHRP
jgi:FMN phosphatase YigB (HAD superfamily)